MVTITGGSGFVGQLLRVGLAERGWRVDIYDRLRGPLLNLLRRGNLGVLRNFGAALCARDLTRLQRSLDPVLLGSGLLKSSEDDILGHRNELAARLKGSDEVIHLAGIAHPKTPGATTRIFNVLTMKVLSTFMGPPAKRVSASFCLPPRDWFMALTIP